jgi:uncharacterized protein (UPF0248 family)
MKGNHTSGYKQRHHIWSGGNRGESRRLAILDIIEETQKCNRLFDMNYIPYERRILDIQKYKLEIIQL